jgi:hypothetical protein
MPATEHLFAGIFIRENELLKLRHHIVKPLISFLGLF